MNVVNGLRQLDYHSQTILQRQFGFPTKKYVETGAAQMLHQNIFIVVSRSPMLVGFDDEFVFDGLGNQTLERKLQVLISASLGLGFFGVDQFQSKNVSRRDFFCGIVFRNGPRDRIVIKLETLTNIQSFRQFLAKYSTEKTHILPVHDERQFVSQNHEGHRPFAGILHSREMKSMDERLWAHAAFGTRDLATRGAKVRDLEP